MVSIDAPHSEMAGTFIRHLTSLQSGTGSDVFPLPPLNLQLNGGERATIALEPALITFLDTLKRRRFLAEWEDAVIQK